MNKRWNILYTAVDEGAVAEIRAKTGVSPLLALLLAERGVTPDSARGYFASGLSGLHDPFLLKDMDKAVSRIRTAIEKKEKITVYGDYDVDGISSVSLLIACLRNMGAMCDFYIPDRETEGYGMNRDATCRIAASGTTLIITVDTGITAAVEVEIAKSLGVDTIVTDHHSVPETLPLAYAVINPKQKDCPYPYKSLAGGGVAFKLVCALLGDTREAVSRYVDIAALATIADVVELTGENRVLAALGLRKMRKLPSVAIRALCEVSSISHETLCAYQIGFGIAPRINAAGRMGSCAPAVELLLTEDAEKALEIAAALDAQNAMRKAIGDKIYEDALALIDAGTYENKKVIVLHAPDWHHGIIGIIASKITEKYYKSTILISEDGEMAKGSGRSIAGFNLYDALCAASETLTRYGGHALAAGLTLPTENIEAFDTIINQYAESVLTDADMQPVIDIDAPLSLTDPLLSLAEELSLLEPFGPGNTRPLFLIEGVKVSSVRVSRDSKHLFLRLWKDGAAHDAVAFGKGALAETIDRGDMVDVVGELQINTYGGKKTPQIIIQDLRKL